MRINISLFLDCFVYQIMSGRTAGRRGPRGRFVRAETSIQSPGADGDMGPPPSKAVAQEGAGLFGAMFEDEPSSGSFTEPPSPGGGGGGWPFGPKYSPGRGPLRGPVRRPSASDIQKMRSAAALYRAYKRELYRTMPGSGVSPKNLFRGITSARKAMGISMDTLARVWPVSRVRSLVDHLQRSGIRSKKTGRQKIPNAKTVLKAMGLAKHRISVSGMFYNVRTGQKEQRTVKKLVYDHWPGGKYGNTSPNVYVKTFRPNLFKSGPKPAPGSGQFYPGGKNIYTSQGTQWRG